MKNLIIDLDNTLTIDKSSKDYEYKTPNLALCKKLELYKKMGFKISIFTSRNMKTYNGNLEEIKSNTLPIIIKWLEKHKIVYDEIIIGKAWCGENGFYVDDKAIRPSEFATLNYKQIWQLLKKEENKTLCLNSKFKKKSKQKNTKISSRKRAKK